MAKRYLDHRRSGIHRFTLVPALLGDGHGVVALDDLSTGFFKQHRRSAGRAFQFVRGSVEDEATVNILMSQCDAVFHLASAVGVQLIIDEPVRTIRTTIHGTEVVLEAACRYGRPALITSSSEVYGKGARVPFSEDDDVVMGVDPSEPLVLCLQQGNRRIPGPGVSQAVRLAGAHRPPVQHRRAKADGNVWHGSAEVRRGAALGNQPLQVYGDGRQTRCFCHVADVVDAIVRLFDSRPRP